MARAKRSLLFVGIKHHVVALDRKTGAEVWRTQLPAKYRTGAMLLSVFFDGEGLFASTAGEVFALDYKSGSVLWHEPFKGLGTGFVTLASELGSSSGLSEAVAAAVALQVAATAAAT